MEFEFTCPKCKTINKFEIIFLQSSEVLCHMCNTTLGIKHIKHIIEVEKL